MTTPRSDSGKTTKSTTSKTPAKAKTPDAIALLKADHRKVEDLFEEYEKAKRADKKSQIVISICDELTIHAALEETGFYPQVKEALGEEGDLVSEATVEHSSLKWLIEQLKAEAPDSELYDAKVKVLQEYVDHHVKEEEKEMFPKVKKSELDIQAIGEQLAELKPQLQKKMLVH